MKFTEVLNSIGDEDEITPGSLGGKIPVKELNLSPEPLLDVPTDAKPFDVELSEENLAIADSLNIPRGIIEKFHKFFNSDFGNDVKVAGPRLKRFWQNEKLDDKDYLIMRDFVYAKAMQKFVREYKSFICGETDIFQKNLLVTAPVGFMQRELLYYMTWLMELYRADKGDKPKDKWVLKAAQAPVLSTLDIHFLKTGMHDASGEDTGGCNLKQIYSSPLLCVTLCGDVRVDSEIVHEIYTYRSTHLQNACSCFVVTSSIGMDLYSTDRYFGDLWKEMTTANESVSDDKDVGKMDPRFYKLYCYFKSERDALAPIGIGGAQSSDLLKTFF